MNRTRKLREKAVSVYIQDGPKRVRKHTDKLISPLKKAAKASGLFVGNRSDKGRETVKRLAERITFGKPVKRKKRKRRKKRR